MEADLQLRQTCRRRGNILKLIRQGHEQQLDRMNDSMVGGLMQDIGSRMSPAQVMTMLQDMQLMGLITFEQRFCDIRERYVAEKIMLTPVGLALVSRRKDTDEVIFN